ncbi:MAG: nitrous oxide reductase family maturation protein NosD [bacterium]
MTAHLVAFALVSMLGAGAAGADTPPVSPPFDLRGAVAAASDGDVIDVPPGVHAGPLVLDKRVTLEGRGRAVIQGPGAGDVIRIAAPGTVVRGLVVRGTGTDLVGQNSAIHVVAPDVTVEGNVLEDALFGISLDSAPRAVIRGNVIRGMALPLGRRGDAIRLWSSDDATIEGNTVQRARDVVIWYCKRVRLTGNRVSQGRYGMHFMYAEGVTLVGNRLEDNSVGAYLMYSKDLVVRDNLFARSRGPSGFGLGLKDDDRVDTQDNCIVGNRVGIYIDNTPWSSTVHDDFTRNVIALNDLGVEFLPAVQRNRFSNNAFMDNIEQIALAGDGELRGNDFTPGGVGNYWSDYAGYDLAGDGAGDLPYRAESLFENLMDREKGLRLFLFSPAQQTIELAARALPIIKPRPKAVDTAPRMRPAVLDLPLPGASPRWPFLALAGVLGAGSLLTLRGAADDRKPRREPRAPAAAEAVQVMAAPLVRMSRIRKRYGAFVALDGIEVDVREGEAVALWGRNGAGKTTAIRCLLGLCHFEGTLEVAGWDVRRRGKDVRRLLGYVPQELAFHDDPRTRETLEFYARLKHVPVARVDEVLAEVDLAEHASKRIRELSGGMKQRVALAAALLAEPPILVLDEMTSSLDQSSRAGFLKLLLRLKERGKTILFTSHRIDDVRRLADRVIVLERGRVRSTCTPEDLPAALGLVTTLRVRVGSVAAAAAALRNAGFEPSTNGGDVVEVRVPPDRKLDVIRTLDLAGAAPADLEIESDGGADDEDSVAPKEA